MSYRRLVVFLCASLALATAGSAQLPDMQPFAVRMAQAVAKSKPKSVIVVDFAGPDEKTTELGRTLADRFSAALSKSSGKFSVADRR